MTGEPGAAVREWRAAWPVVVASFFGMTLLGMGFLSNGAYISSLEHEFGWTRAEVSSAFSVYAIPGILLAPPVGVILDKWGARRVALPGALLVGLSWALFSTLNGSLAYWLFLWLLLASASQLIMMMVWSAAVSNNFAASRGLALSIMMMGNGLTTVVAPILSNFLIEHYGWRTAYLVEGLGWGGLVAGVGYFMLNDRRERRPDEIARPAVADQPGYSVPEGIRSPGFIKIALAVFLASLLNMALMIHLIPVLGEDGLSRDTAVWVTGSLGVSMIAGKILNGVVTDHMPAKYLAACWVALPAVACVMLLQPTGSVMQRAVAANLFGAAAGAQMPVFMYVATRYFGLRNFGTLFGMITSGIAIATAIGPFTAGYLHDLAGSYAPLLIAGIPLSLLASLVVLSLGRYPQFDNVAAEPAAAADPVAA
jgi:MFS family permease